MFGMFVGAGMVSPAGSVKRFCLTAEVSPGDPRRPKAHNTTKPDVCDKTHYALT